MSNDLYISRMAKGTHKRFRDNMSELIQMFPKANTKWVIGAAVHISCVQNGKGTWEYRNVVPVETGPYTKYYKPTSLSAADVRTIKPATIRDKYKRYLKEATRNA